MSEPIAERGVSARRRETSISADCTPARGQSRRTTQVRTKPKTKLVTVAHRGDVFVQEVELRYVLAYGSGGGSKRSKKYQLAIVTAVTREGRIKAYRAAGDATVYKSVPCNTALVAAALVDVPALEASYVARGDPHAREFKSFDEARDFIRPHLRSSTS